MRRWRPAVVAALVVLAGCGSLFGVSSTPSDESATVTPAPVPTTATDSASRAAVPLSQYPGVSADGSVEPNGLLLSHVNALSNRSFTLVWSRVEVNRSAESRTRVFRRRAAVENHSTYRYDARGAAVEGRVQKYSGPDGRYGRRVAADGSAMTGRLLDEGESANARFAKVITTALRSALGQGVEMSLVDRGGQRYLRLVSDEPPDYFATIYGPVVRNYRATVYVHPDGYVRAIHYSLDAVTESGAVHVERWYRYTNVGETTVAKPDWVAPLEGIDSVETTSANGTADGDGPETDTADGNETTGGTPTPRGTPAG